MSVRRWVSASAIVVLGAGLVLQPVPAGARVGSAQLTADDSISRLDRDECIDTVSTSGREPQTVRLRTDGVWQAIPRLTREGQISTSAVRAASDVSGRVATDSWGTTRVGMRIATTITARPSRPASYCEFSYSVDAFVEVFDVTVRGLSWLVVRSSGKSAGAVQDLLRAARSDDKVQLSVRPGGSITRLVPGGSYGLGGGSTSTVTVPRNTSDPRAASSSIAATISVYPIGTRRTHSGATGYARSGHRSCTEHKVRITLTDKARNRARRITFYVDGDRRRVLTGSAIQRPGLTLRSIRPASYGKVRVVVHTRSGARRTLRSTTWPCRA